MKKTYDLMESPIGGWMVVANDEGVTAIVRVKDAEDVAYRLEQYGATAQRKDHPVLREAVKQLAAYFKGTLQGFSFPVSIEGSAYRRKVWEAMATIPHGKTVSYSELATMAGNPTAFRAAASACAQNPLAIYHPCHRVLHKDGGMSGYAYGTEVKEWLLAHEAKAKAKRAA